MKEMEEAGKGYIRDKKKDMLPYTVELPSKDEREEEDQEEGVKEGVRVNMKKNVRIEMGI